MNNNNFMNFMASMNVPFGGMIGCSTGMFGMSPMGCMQTMLGTPAYGFNPMRNMSPMMCGSPMMSNMNYQMNNMCMMNNMDMMIIICV